MNQELQNLEGAAAAADLVAETNNAPIQPGEVAAPAVPVMTAQQAQSEAAGITAALAAAVETLWPVVGFSQEIRDTFTAKLAPVLQKHNLSSVFGRWAEEVALGAFTAGLLVGGFKAVKAAKAEPNLQTDTVRPDGRQ